MQPAIVQDFYRRLAEVRSEAASEKDASPTPGGEYITSYRHLREHGNAFMIVLLEVILAYALYTSPSETLTVVILGLWIAPAAMVWFLATGLESRMVDDPLPAIEKPRTSEKSETQLPSGLG